MLCGNGGNFRWSCNAFFSVQCGFRGFLLRRKGRTGYIILLGKIALLLNFFNRVAVNYITRVKDKFYLQENMLVKTTTKKYKTTHQKLSVISTTLCPCGGKRKFLWPESSPDPKLSGDVNGLPLSHG